MSQLHHVTLLLLIPLGGYCLISLLLGWLAARQRVSANDFLNATNSVPLWIVSTAFLSANCGALDLLGLSALATQYGVQAFQFFWIGAIPGMVYVSLRMLRTYTRMGVRSVPEYLEQRYDKRVKLLNAFSFAITIVAMAGINLYAIGQTLRVLAGLPFLGSMLVAACVVGLYVLLGGIRATIYNEAFQLVILLACLCPLLPIMAHRGLLNGSLPGTRGHLWTALPAFSTAAPFDAFGVVLGLGFVLGFSYWSTDFILMQRALAAEGSFKAREVPLLAGFGKLAISFFVVLPALYAPVLIPGLGREIRYDAALPSLMALFYNPVLLALGVTALIASLMSGLAANVSAFASVWTEDIYRTQVAPGRSEEHYLRIARAATGTAILLGLLASEISFRFTNLMEQIQFVLAIFGPSFWAIFLLGRWKPSVNAQAALGGLTCGVSIALIHQGLVLGGVFHYGSMMSANYHVAVYGFTACFLAAFALRSSRDDSADAPDSEDAATLKNSDERAILIWSAILVTLCIGVNWIWR